MLASVSYDRFIRVGPERNSGTCRRGLTFHPFGTIALRNERKPDSAVSMREVNHPIRCALMIGQKVKAWESVCGVGM